MPGHGTTRESQRYACPQHDGHTSEKAASIAIRTSWLRHYFVDAGTSTVNVVNNAGSSVWSQTGLEHVSPSVPQSTRHSKCGVDGILTGWYTATPAWKTLTLHLNQIWPARTAASEGHSQVLALSLQKTTGFTNGKQLTKRHARPSDVFHRVPPWKPTVMQHVAGHGHPRSRLQQHASVGSATAELCKSKFSGALSQSNSDTELSHIASLNEWHAVLL